MNSTLEGSNRLVINFLSLRKSVGILGMFFPVFVAVGGAVIYHLDLRPSFSDYYHSPMRDVYIGILCAIGVFLISYRGYDRRDNIVSTVAGIAALGTAFFPVDAISITDRTMTGLLHGAFAGTYLAGLTYFCLCLFVKSSSQKPPTPNKILRNKIYRFCGWILIACLLSLGGVQLLPDALKQQTNTLCIIFWLEAIASVAFGFAWFVKGEGLFEDN